MGNSELATLAHSHHMLAIRRPFTPHNITQPTPIATEHAHDDPNHTLHTPPYIPQVMETQWDGIAGIPHLPWQWDGIAGIPHRFRITAVHLNLRRRHRIQKRLHLDPRRMG